MFEQLNDSLVFSFAMMFFGILLLCISLSILRLLWALHKYNPPTETYAEGCEHLEKGPGVRHGMVRDKDGNVKGVTSVDHWERLKPFL